MSVLKLISSQNNIRAHNTSVCSGRMAPFAQSFPNQMTDWQNQLVMLPTARHKHFQRHVGVQIHTDYTIQSTWNKTAHIISIKTSVYPQVYPLPVFRKRTERLIPALFNTARSRDNFTAKFQEQFHSECWSWDTCLGPMLLQSTKIEASDKTPAVLVSDSIQHQCQSLKEPFVHITWGKAAAHNFTQATNFQVTEVR